MPAKTSREEKSAVAYYSVAGVGSCMKVRSEPFVACPRLPKSCDSGGFFAAII